MWQTGKLMKLHGQKDQNANMTTAFPVFFLFFFLFSRSPKGMKNVLDKYVLKRCHLYVCTRARRHHLCVDITPSLSSTVTAGWTWNARSDKQVVPHSQLHFLSEEISAVLKARVNHLIARLMSRRKQNFFP